MKKNLLLVAISIMAIAFFNSCSSDRDDDSNPKYNIIGKWKAMEYKNTNGSWESMSILNWYSQFNTDGTYVTFNGKTFNGTYSYDNKNKITAKAGGETVVYTIHSMNNNTAEAEMYYESNPSDKLTYRLQKQ